MATDKQKADLSTAAVGYGLAAGGAGISEVGIRHLHRRLPRIQANTRPVQAMWRARKNPIARPAQGIYLAGRALTAVGGIGAIHGTTKYVHDRRLNKALTAPAEPEHHNLLMEGIQGQADAIKAKVKETKDAKHTPLKAHVISLGLGAFGGAAGGKAAGLAAARTKQFNRPVQAVAGIAGATAVQPLANKINNHFKVRARRKPVRPSSKASSVEARSSRGADPRAARSAIVPVGKALKIRVISDASRFVARPRPTYGLGSHLRSPLQLRPFEKPLTNEQIERQARAAINAKDWKTSAGTRRVTSTPEIRDAVTASRPGAMLGSFGPHTSLGSRNRYGISKIAARLVFHGTTPKAAHKIMSTGHFRESVNAHRLGAGEGVYATTGKQKYAAQGYAIGRTSQAYGRLTPSRGKVITSMSFGPAKNGVIRDGGIKERVYHPSQLIPVRSDGVKAHRIPELMSELRKMDDPSEVHVNGTLQATGKKRPRQPTPYELMNRRGKVRKLDNGYTAAEARHQLNRKKRKLVADVASTGLGIGGLALLGASHPASGLKSVHRAKLARIAGTTAVLGGGVGAVNSIQGINVTRHDIKAQQKVIKSGILAIADDIPVITNTVSNIVGGGKKKQTNGRLMPTSPPVSLIPDPVSKAFRVPGFRSSYLRTRRLGNGTLKAVRVNGGVVR